MKRRSLFLTAFVSAAVCFTSLMLFAGPQRSGWNHHYHSFCGGRQHHGYDHYEEDHLPDSIHHH